VECHYKMCELVKLVKTLGDQLPFLVQFADK